jgi:hypothetical protein
VMVLCGQHTEAVEVAGQQTRTTSLCALLVLIDTHAVQVFVKLLGECSRAGGEGAERRATSSVCSPHTAVKRECATVLWGWRSQP